MTIGETAMTIVLIVIAVTSAIGLVIDHCSTPPPPPPRPVSDRRCREMWIVDHRPLDIELRRCRR